MLIFTTDDDPSHNLVIQSIVRQIFNETEKPFEIKSFKNGQEMLNQAEVTPPNLIFLDINMPILDGLSTLVRFRKNNVLTPIIMASSENIHNISRHVSQQKGVDKSDAEKNMLLSKVVQRVASGVEEAGKINSVLQAVSTLRMDPIKVALSNGANAFVSKPYTGGDVKRSLKQLRIL